jgi:hypothetical protein
MGPGMFNGFGQTLVMIAIIIAVLAFGLGAFVTWIFT